MKVLDLIKAAKNNPNHWRSIMQQNTVNYLLSKFPKKSDKFMFSRVKDLKKEIKTTEKQIQNLKDNLKLLRRDLKNTCSHPISHLVHGGYACSGTSYTGKFNHPLHENVYCKACNTRHSFECQETSEDYMGDF